MGFARVTRDEEKENKFCNFQKGEFFEFGNELFIKIDDHSAINLDDIAIGNDGTAFFFANEKIKSVQVELKVL